MGMSASGAALWLMMSTLASPEIKTMFPAGGTSGSEVRVAFTGFLETTGVQLRTSRPGVEFLGLDGKDAFKLRITAEATPGVVWLTFHDQHGASAQRPFIISTFPEALETEPNDAIREAGESVLFPRVMNGVLQKRGDVDTYRVTLKTGETLVAAVEALHSLGSPMDALLSVTDPRGFVLQQTDDAPGFDPRIAFTAPRDGDYYLRVFAFPATPDSSIQYAGGPNYIYRVTLTTGPVVTRWQPAAVTSGSDAMVIGQGWNVPPEGLSVPVPSDVTQPFVIPRHDPAVILAPIIQTATPVVIASPAATPVEPQPLTLPVTISGNFDQPRHINAFRFTTTKGLKQRLRLFTRSLGSPCDGVLRIVDASGKEVLEVDDAPRGDAELDAEFNPPADGDYTLTLRERFDHGSADHRYALSITPTVPTVVATVKESLYSVSSTTVLKLPVQFDRRDGFDAPLTLNIIGLPEGVKFEAKTSEPQGDTSKSVNLIIESTRTEPWLGPITITATPTTGEMTPFTAIIDPPERSIAPPEVLLMVTP
jgi:hypothetical protein